MVFDRSGELTELDNITKKEDVTPDKGADNLMQLLSSLEGLTPAGLEHLMETQDKLAATTVPKQETKNAFMDLDLASKKMSDSTVHQPHFGSGIRSTSPLTQRCNTATN